jgi:alcohol dehydrogenase class IV
VNVGNVHAIAHQLGGKYGIPHGLANALVLPHVLDFCFEEVQLELAELAVLVGAGSEGEHTGILAHKFITAVRDLRTAVGIPDHSDQIKQQDFDLLCQQAIEEGGTYPVPRLLDRESVMIMLNNIAG